MAVDWLRRKREKPFLLILGHKAPHTPFTPEPRYEHIFDGVTIAPPPTAGDTGAGKPAWIRERLRTWHGVQGPLFGLKDYDTFVRSYLATICSVDDSVGALYETLRAAGRLDDTILLALVELARSDELAGRIVLQHLLPALISNARRYRSYTDRTDPITQIVPAAWLAIRSYDVDRRRHHVAASLISDSVFQAFRRQLRRCAASEEPTAPMSFANAAHHDGPANALDEFVTVLRDARRAGVAAYDLDLLRQLVRVGSPSVVAAQRKVTPRTLRNHRDRAVDHVRTALAVAA